MFERLFIKNALAQAQGNRAEAAERLGIHRQLLHRKLTRYGVEKGLWGDPGKHRYLARTTADLR